MQSVPRQTRVILDLGITPCLPPADRKRIQLANLAAFSLAWIVILCSAIFFYFDLPILGRLALTFSGGYFAVLGFNRLGFNRLARILLMSNLSAVVYVFASSMGKDSGAFFWFVPATIAPSVLFSTKEKPYLLGFSLSVFVMFWWLWESNFNYPAVNIQPIPTTVVTILSSCMIVGSFSTTFGLILFLLVTHERSVGDVHNSKIELQEREHQLRSLIDGIPALVSYWGRDQRAIIANRYYAPYFGRTPTEMRGLHIRDMVGIVAYERARPSIEKVLAGEAQIFEHVVPIMDGSLRSLRIHYQPNTVDGHVHGYYVVAIDITKERDSENLLEETQRVGKIGSWSVSAKDKKVKWSSQMFRLFSMDSHDPPPGLDKFQENIHPDDRAGWRAALDAAVRERRSYRVRYRPASSNGNLWIEVIGEPIFDADGALSGLRGTSQDVTDLVAAEESLKSERAKAIHANKLAALGEMAGGIAHEINNPIAIIDGSAHRALKLLRRPAPDLLEIEKFMIEIQETAQRVVRIVAGLRTVSRDSEHDPYELIDIRLLVDEVLVLCRERLQSHEVKFSLDFQSSSAAVLGNRTQLAQVLLNLINNADDAMTGQSRKWLRLEVKETEGTRRRLEISLTNSGHRIPEAIRAKMFTPFFTTKEVGKGTGLGLSLSRKIAEGHNGLLVLDDHSDNTRFVLTLPAAHAETNEKTA